MIDLCVINFNTRDKLVRLVSTLFEDYDSKVWTLSVADNGSTDGSVDLFDHFLDTFGGKLAHLRKNSNIGYAAACNQLAATGSGDVIGLLNADVWLTTNDLRKIQTRFDDGVADVLGPKQRNEAGYITHAGIFGTNTEPRHRGWKMLDAADMKFVDTVEAVTVSGSAYFIRRSAWDELTNCPLYATLPIVESAKFKGAFLPTPHYYEETYCSYHARAHGYKVIYDGSISIGHSWHASSEVGGPAEQQMPASQRLFREACFAHDIECD